MDPRRLDLLVRALLVGAVVCAVLALAVVPHPTVARAEQAADPLDADVSRVLAGMTLADRAGQLVVTSVPGTRIAPATARQLRALHPSGIVLFADNHRSLAQLRRFVAAATTAARDWRGGGPLPIVTVDQEGGVVKRIASIPPTRSHPQLGAIDRTALTRSQARRTGRALRELGIHVDLAPVADLDHGPAHVMRERSFGRSPALVSRHVGAFVDGLTDSGTAAAVKHFPGFGGASGNSDDVPARVDRTRSQLDADLRPFRTAIAHDVELVMVSHAVYRALDRRHPASTSPAVYRLLRRDLGFRGVAITDSLHADGFTAAARTSVARGCVQVVRAGADIALLTGTVADALACRTELLRAVRTGALPRARFDEAVRRVLHLKAAHQLLPGSSGVV